MSLRLLALLAVELARRGDAEAGGRDLGLEDVGEELREAEREAEHEDRAERGGLRNWGLLTLDSKTPAKER